MNKFDELEDVTNRFYSTISDKIRELQAIHKSYKYRGRVTLSGWFAKFDWNITESSNICVSSVGSHGAVVRYEDTWVFNRDICIYFAKHYKSFKKRMIKKMDKYNREQENNEKKLINILNDLMKS